MLRCLSMPTSGEAPMSELAGRLPSRPQAGLAPGCGDIKPRLTKDQHEFLEKEFQKQHKPSTATKRGYANSLQVPLEKINNWFQNRRAKVKQDQKKALMNPTNAMAPPSTKKSSKADRHPYMSNQGQYFASTPNLHQPVSKSDSHSHPYGSGRLVNSQVDLSIDFGSSLHSISESASTATTDSLMQSLMSVGYEFSPNHGADNLLLNSGFPENVPDFSSSTMYSTNVSNDTGFAMSNYSNSASTSTNNLGMYSSDSGVSAAMTQATAPSLTTPGLVSSINTNLTDWTEDSMHSPGTLASGSQYEDSVEGSVSNFGLDSSSSQDLPIWSAGPQEAPGFLTSQSLYLQNDCSSQPLLPSAAASLDRSATIRRSPSGFEQLSEDSFGRRASSASVLTDSIVTDAKPARKISELPSSIASRRQRPRPAALGPASLRSSSYSAGVPGSPGLDPEQSLRRIRSSNGMASRIKKPGTVSAQRSPLAMSFPDLTTSAASSYDSSIAPGSAAPGNSLAPPTPMTPGGFGYTDILGNDMTSMTHAFNVEHGFPLDAPGSWSHDVATHPRLSNESPPYTPLDKFRLDTAPHSRANSTSLFQEVPPQSAPATQQFFAVPSFPRLGSNTFGSSVAPPRQQHSRSPSMPVVTTSVSAMEQNAAFAIPAGLDSFVEESHQTRATHTRGASDVSALQVKPEVQIVPSEPASNVTPDFEVHEYHPPEGVQVSSPPRILDSQPKTFTFSNHGLKDFQSE